MRGWDHHTLGPCPLPLKSHSFDFNAVFGDFSRDNGNAIEMKAVLVIKNRWVYVGGRIAVSRPLAQNTKLPG